MRATKIVIVIWLLCSLAVWVRDGQGFSVLDTLPFVQRSQPISRNYDRYALAALLIGLWGYLLITRQHGKRPRKLATRPITSILLVPATIIGLTLITQRITPAYRFSEVFSGAGHLAEYRHLVTLCLLVFAVLLVIKWFRNG